MQVLKRLPLTVFRLHIAYISSYKTVKLLKKLQKFPLVRTFSILDF